MGWSSHWTLGNTASQSSYSRPPSKQHTQTKHYALPQLSAFILIQWLAVPCSNAQRRNIHQGLCRQCFLFPSLPPIHNEVVCSKKRLLNGTCSQWIWESGEFGFSNFLFLFPAISQLRQSCVECGRLQKNWVWGVGVLRVLTFFLQHNNCC